MTNHENPKRNLIAERSQFNMRSRKRGESVSQYMAELRRRSQYCEYGDSLDSMLRDRLVCGIKAMDFSLSLESAIKQASAIQNEFKQRNEAVSKTEQKTSSRNQSAKCFRCDNLHNPKSCPFIDKECFFTKIKCTH